VGSSAGISKARGLRCVEGSVAPLMVGLSLVLVALCLLASPALATTGHNYAGQFGIPNSSAPGGFSGGGPSAVAVQQSTGDVFVADNAHPNPDFSPAPRIERFDAGGSALSAFAIDGTLYAAPSSLAIDPAGGGSVYVGAFDNTTQVGTVLKYSAAGVFVSALDASTSGTNISYPTQVAVDAGNGNVYVNAFDAISGAPLIDEFDSSGSFLASFDGSSGSPDGGFASIAGIAVDAGHRLYVTDNAKNRVDRYSAAGAFQATVDDGSHGGVGAVAADPTSSEVYVVENAGSGPQVAWYDAGGSSRLETFGTGRIGGASGLAVNHSSGAVYTSDTTNAVVERFTVFTGPTVTTDPAASVDPNNETLNGTVNPGGLAATFHFDYGPDTNYGSSTAETSAGSGGSAAPVSGTASGLTPNTLYHYRIVGSNAGGSIAGADETFITAPAPPTPEGPPAPSSIATTQAFLTGLVNPQGSATTFHFEYGPTTAYGSQTPDDPTSAGAGQGGVQVATPATGLTPGTTYHFRLVAENGTGGAQYSPDGTFLTAPGTPAGATGVTGNSAFLTGVVNPHGVNTTYHFEYGTDTSYGIKTIEKNAGSGTEETTVTQLLNNLQPGTTYHVRVVATDVNANVTTTGDDGTFTTDPAPEAATGAVTGVTTDHATFAGTYDTHAIAGTYQFFVHSTTSPYASNTAPVSIAGAGAAAGTLTDLVPGETYVVRLGVTVSGVTTTGDPVTFSTPPLPAPPAAAPQPPPPPISANPPPPNGFTATAKVKGATATVSVKVPGPGEIAVTNANVKRASKHASGAATYSVKVSLTPQAARSLEQKPLTTSLTVRFTPTGGDTAKKSLPVTFKRLPSGRDCRNSCGRKS
jgi:hypothetical protein